MKDQESWDRYGAFYEKRPKAVAPLPRRRPLWWRILGLVGGAAFGVGFWFFFIWAGTRLWPR